MYVLDFELGGCILKTSSKVASVGSILMLFMIAVGVRPASATPVTFNDTFEGGSLDPFWSVVQQNGTVSLSTVQAETGTQSVAFSSTSGSVNGGQRELHLQHTFSSLLTGNASIWFFDAAPGQQTLYEQFNLTNSVTGAVYSLGTMDFDGSCYEAQVAGAGPNANCGSFPTLSTTNVARTGGWHLFDIDVLPGSVSLSIDNVEVFSSLGSQSFDGIDILTSGPGFRPNTTSYWDNFSLDAQTAPVPEPASLTLLGVGLVGVVARRQFSTRK